MLSVLPAERCIAMLTSSKLQEAFATFKDRTVAALTCDCAVGRIDLAGLNAAPRGEAGALAAAVVLDCAAQVMRDLASTRLSDDVSVMKLASAVVLDLPTIAYSPARVQFDDRRCKRPEYPRPALINEATGRTTLLFKVSSTGVPLDVSIVESAGTTISHKLLDYSVALAGMACTFTPAQWNGHAIEDWMRVQYVWTLR